VDPPVVAGSTRPSPDFCKTVQVVKPWRLFFDGSKSELAVGVGIVIEDPFGAKYAYSFRLDFDSTNNRAEYEALIIGLEMILELGVKHLEVFRDSQLVIKQLTNEYKCRDPTMAAYYVAAGNLSSMFKDISVKYFPREQNLAANEMAQIASGIQIQEHQSERTITMQKKFLPSIISRGMDLEINANEVQAGDWRKPLIDYLTNPSPR
ncbi:PREDICTED: retrotransposon unclassified, partial [Prunus dulcis]